MNKSKVILSAILVIALCASLVCGATFALFTSESKVNIAVTSGKVAVTAVVDGDLTLSHQEADAAEATGYKTVEGSLYSGKATLDTDTQTISIEKMVPMDKIVFSIKITNESNVGVIYRTVVACQEDDGLFDGLKITIGGEEFYGDAATDFAQLTASELTVDVSIELPEEASNLFQDKACKIYYKVEAVQGNAKTDEIHVNATNVQEYLDGEHGSIDGKRIILEAGDYDRLYIRQSTAASTRREDLDKWTPTYLVYYRSIKNLTIKAADGATVNCEGITVEAGLHNATTAPASNNDMNNGNFVSALALEKISIEGINFTATDANAILLEDNNQDKAITGSDLLVDGLTIKNCSGTGSNASDAHFFQAGSGTGSGDFLDTGKKALNNIKLVGNTISNYNQAICFNNSSAVLNGLSVVNNTFVNSVSCNVIQLSNLQNAGKFVFANNIVKGLNGRFIRMTTPQADAKIVFVNNTFESITAYDADGSVAKITGGVEGYSVVESGNDWADGTYSSNGATWIANGK